MLFFVSGVVYFDMPYGLGHASWDTEVWSEEKIALFLREATVVCTPVAGHLGINL